MLHPSIRRMTIRSRTLRIPLLFMLVYQENWLQTLIEMKKNRQWTVIRCKIFESWNQSFSGRKVVQTAIHGWKKYFLLHLYWFLHSGWVCPAVPSLGPGRGAENKAQVRQKVSAIFWPAGTKRNSSLTEVCGQYLSWNKMVKFIGPKKFHIMMHSKTLRTSDHSLDSTISEGKFKWCTAACT